MKILNLISVLAIGLLALFVFKSWLFSPILSAGDSWYYFSSMFNNHFLHPYAWYTYSVSTGLGGQGFAYVNTYFVVAVLLELAKLFGLSWENISRILFNFAFLGISFASSLFIIRKLLPKEIPWLLAPVVFIFNTYILMLVGGGLIITALSYSLVPFSFYLFTKLLDFKVLRENSTVLYMGAFSIIFFLQCILDLRIAFVAGIAMLIYLIVSLFYRDVRFKNLLMIFFSFILIGLLSAYWLIPMLFFRIDPIAQLGTNYTSSEIVKFLSFATLENASGLMHPYWPENIFGKIGFMKPEFLVLPIIAFSSLLFIKKGKEGKIILSFVLIGLIGIFLGKGAGEPFGGAYIWFFEHVPGFQLFRDSFKWYVLIALSFTVLIPYSVHMIGKVLDTRFRNKYISYLLLITTFLYLIFLIRPAILGQIGGTFKSRSVPIEYEELNNFISSEPSFMRTIWVPNTMLFGYYSNTHPEISARDFYNEYDQKKLIEIFSKDSSREMLETSSVKYVIVPADTENQIYLTERRYDVKKYKYFISELDKIPWLEKEKLFGKIVVYKTQEYKDHFWCNCEAIIDYEFINPTKYRVKINNAKKGDKLIFSETFDEKWIAWNENYLINSTPFGKKYNSFVLPEGDSILDIYYTPQKFVEVGLRVSMLSAAFILGIMFVVLVKKLKK